MEGASGSRHGSWLDETSHFRTVTIPKVYFFAYSVGSVFLLPFVNVFYAKLGFRPELIGILAALKPWVAAPCGSLIVGLADASRRHYAVFLAVYLVAFWGRSCMTFFTGKLLPSFGVQLALALLTEAAASPQGALVDAAVMASATDDGGYGRIRTWASIGWGCTAPLAGWVVAQFSLRAAFLCFTALVGATLLPATLLPMGALSASKAAAAQGDARPRPASDSDGGGAHLSCKGGSEAKLGTSAEEPPGTVAVRIAAGSQQREAGAGEAAAWEAGGHAAPAAPKRSPAPQLAHSWSISSAAAPALNLLADCRSAGEPPSPERPLLAAAERSDSPAPALLAPAPARTSTTGSFAISSAPVDSGSKGQLGGGAASAVAGGAQPVGAWRGLCQLAGDIHVAAFFFLAFLAGIGNGCIGYLFLFLDELGASGTLMGLCLSFNCAAEVPVFFWSGPILERLGVERAFHAAMGAYVLRLLCYLALPLLPSPWLVLPVELLQGATFALAWSAGTVYVKRISPPHLRSTVQSVFQGLYTGIGAGVGGLVGGLLYGRLGSAALFRTAALVLAAGWLATCAVLRKWGGREGSGHGGAGDGARRQQEEAAGVAYRLVVQASSEGDAEDAALLLRGS